MAFVHRSAKREVVYKCAAAILCLLAATSCPSLQASEIKLRFNNDGTFKILQVADMHYGNGRSTDCSDVLPAELPFCSDLNTTAFVRRLIREEAPDLIVFSGDNIGWSASDAKRAMEEAFAPAIEANIPWAAVLGNHDVESNMNRQQLMDYISQMKLSLTSVQNPQMDGTYGWGNYYLQVFGSLGGAMEKKSLLNLYFLDSGDNSKVAGVKGYDWIRGSQIIWFSKLSQQLRANSYSPVPALAYFHIPLPEYDTVLYEDRILGVQQEDVFSPPVNSGFFSALRENGDVKATFVGHDHVNDYCGKLMGINLCYGGGTGYHAYGKVGWSRRARVVVAALDRQTTGYFAGTPNISTWKRLDDKRLSKEDMQLLYSKATEFLSTSNAFAYRKGCCYIWTPFKYRQGTCYVWNVLTYTGVFLLLSGVAFLWGCFVHKCTFKNSGLAAYRLVKPGAKVQD